MEQPIIAVNQLYRTYSVPIRREGVLGSVANLFVRRHKTIEALAGISFNIEQGEVVGLIGPNGAGKSTTIKILTGILTPTRGDVKVMGRTPYRHRKWLGGRIGAMFGQRTQLWWDLTPLDAFQMLRHIYDIPLEKFKQNLSRYTEILGLESFLAQPVRKLSLGQRVRADLAACLLHDPAIIFLDEPTIGLDVVVKERVHTLIRHLSDERDVTVILTTHDLRDIETVCRRTIIINKGRIVFDGTLKSLKETLGGIQTLVCYLKDSGSIPSAEQLALSAQVAYTSDTRELRVVFDTREVPTVTVIKAVMDKYQIENLALTETPIEEVVKQFYRSEP
jgi:ABC-2 type transport system ATP-binding protein